MLLIVLDKLELTTEPYIHVYPKEFKQSFLIAVSLTRTFNYFRMATAEKPKSKKKKQKEKKALKKDIAATYNDYKMFEGQQYTGMKIGRSHKWYYDQGVWKEKKITPDKWEFNYAVIKRRAGKAPEGSGVPVGTEYHWYMLAHQHVRKLDANNYTTAMSGLKFKLAHKRFDKKNWNASDKAQRKRLIKIFKEMIAQLKKENEKEK